jgi:hypothetical protein
MFCVAFCLCKLKPVAFAIVCVCVVKRNGVGGEPIITHGHTLTSRLLAHDVLRIISEWAFGDASLPIFVARSSCALILAAIVSSPYPVILSIENHCNEAQEEKLAQAMRLLFGDKL